MYAEVAAVLEPCPDPEPHLQFSCMLAKALDASLVALHSSIVEPAPFGLFLRSQRAMVATEVAAARTARADVAVRKSFETIASDAGIQWEWRELGEAATARIAWHARYSDLLLLFGQNPSGDANTAALNIPGVIMESGRPALVLPSGYPSPPLPFRRILIGWNASREASRAVHDALPFLRQAEQVVVATVAEESLFREDDEPALDIGRHLARHGIKAELRRIGTPGLDTGTQLLSLAGSMSADMIVVGCYGHMRLTEFFFGGVSRTLLRDSDIPLLLSY
jgi:nucleotide-binding universal stress UspA family protein